MELPPGWRGYGTKDYIENPETVDRLREIERIKQASPNMDRFQQQEQLMRYDQLLPPRFRHRNERIGDKTK